MFDLLKNWWPGTLSLAVLVILTAYYTYQLVWLFILILKG